MEICREEQERKPEVSAAWHEALLYLVSPMTQSYYLYARRISLAQPFFLLRLIILKKQKKNPHCSSACVCELSMREKVCRNHMTQLCALPSRNMTITFWVWCVYFFFLSVPPCCSGKSGSLVVRGGVLVLKLMLISSLFGCDFVRLKCCCQPFSMESR